MAWLDRFLEKIKIILRLTKRHALNLACFVTIYKSLLMVFRRTGGGRDRPWHTLLAGGIGGYLVFSPDNPVNNQVASGSTGSISPELSDIYVPLRRLSSIYWPE